MRENIVQFGNEYLSINKVFEFMRCGLLTGFSFFFRQGGEEKLKKATIIGKFCLCMTTSILEWLGMGSAFYSVTFPK